MFNLLKNLFSTTVITKAVTNVQTYTDPKDVLYILNELASQGIPVTDERTGNEDGHQHVYTTLEIQGNEVLIDGVSYPLPTTRIDHNKLMFFTVLSDIDKDLISTKIETFCGDTHFIYEEIASKYTSLEYFLVSAIRGTQQTGCRIPAELRMDNSVTSILVLAFSVGEFYSKTLTDCGIIDASLSEENIILTLLGVMLAAR